MCPLATGELATWPGPPVQGEGPGTRASHAALAPLARGTAILWAQEVPVAHLADAVLGTIPQVELTEHAPLAVKAWCRVHPAESPI